MGRTTPTGRASARPFRGTPPGRRTTTRTSPATLSRSRAVLPSLNERGNERGNENKRTRGQEERKKEREGQGERSKERRGCEHERKSEWKAPACEVASA